MLARSEEMDRRQMDIQKGKDPEFRKVSDGIYISDDDDDDGVLSCQDLVLVEGEVRSWGKAARKDRGFIIERQHFDPSLLPRETCLSGLHLINLSPARREQNAILPEHFCTDRNGGGNPMILLRRGNCWAGRGGGRGLSPAAHAPRGVTWDRLLAALFFLPPSTEPGQASPLPSAF